jgi:hypothetical protein
LLLLLLGLGLFGLGRVGLMLLHILVFLIALVAFFVVGFDLLFGCPVALLWLLFGRFALFIV